MPHVLISGDETKCAAIRTQLVQWGLTVGFAPGDASTGASFGVDVCDVVLVVDSDSAAEAVGPDAVSDGGWGAAPDAAPRLFLDVERFAAEGSLALWAGLQTACQRARELRGTRSPARDGADLHVIGHELRSPLTAIKTALEVLEGDLCGWDAAPADVEAQMKMLQIALRNVRRLHRAVEWSQMLLAGPRGGQSDAFDTPPGESTAAPPSAEDESGLSCGFSRAG